MSPAFIFSFVVVGGGGGSNISNTLHFCRATILSLGLICASQVRLTARTDNKMLPSTHNARPVWFIHRSSVEFRLDSHFHCNRPLEIAPESNCCVLICLYLMYQGGGHDTRVPLEWTKGCMCESTEP